MAPENPDPKKDYPQYLDTLQDDTEASIRERVAELRAEIDRLESQLDETRKSKQILFLMGGELRDELVRFLTVGLDLPAKVSEESSDAFWLVAEAVGEEWCLGEVRESASGNVTREMLARVEINRHDAGKPDDFPALLVVNSFHEKENLEDRDQAVPPEMARRANEDHILVVRTLDLVRLRQKEQSGFAGIKDLLEALREGGWFEVNATLISKHHRD